MKRKVLLLFIFMILFFNISAAAYDKESGVHFINTGQSDCILISNNNKNYLIDTGDSSTAEKVLKYLDELKIKDIDQIVITHYHGDHYGGLNSILKSKQVGRVLLPMHDNIMRDVIYKDLTERDISVEYIIPNLEIKNDNMYLKFISPVREDNELINNNSIVIQAEIDGIRYGFMADAEEPEEKDLIKTNKLQQCDVLKVPHHGLDTSTSEQLLKVMKPKIAIITCNGTESPNAPIIDRITKHNIPIFRTDINGDIVVRRSPEKDSNIIVNIR